MRCIFTKSLPFADKFSCSVTRWEHEGDCRELKLEMKKHKYLSSQLLEAAQVEILSMVWASALVARERQRIHEKAQGNRLSPEKMPQGSKAKRQPLAQNQDKK